MNKEIGFLITDGKRYWAGRQQGAVRGAHIDSWSDSKEGAKVLHLREAASMLCATMNVKAKVIQTR